MLFVSNGTEPLQFKKYVKVYMRGFAFHNRHMGVETKYVWVSTHDPLMYTMDIPRDRVDMNTVASGTTQYLNTVMREKHPDWYVNGFHVGYILDRTKIT